MSWESEASKNPRAMRGAPFRAERQASSARRPAGRNFPKIPTWTKMPPHENSTYDETGFGGIEPIGSGAQCETCARCVNG